MHHCLSYVTTAPAVVTSSLVILLVSDCRVAGIRIAEIATFALCWKG